MKENQVRRLYPCSNMVKQGHCMQASNTGSGNSDGDIEVQVRLPDGRLIAVDADPRHRSQSSRSSNKDPIDVEWREVK